MWFQKLIRLPKSDRFSYIDKGYMLNSLKNENKVKIENKETENSINSNKLKEINVEDKNEKNNNSNSNEVKSIASIDVNFIRLQKSNSEANHNNKKIYKEAKHYIITKKNKIPREKIIQNSHNLKLKVKSILNSHSHIPSSTSPFCKICGSINFINKETNKLIESIKPHNYFYSPEISITSIFQNLKNKTNSEYESLFYEFKEKKIFSNIIEIRNKIINKFIDYSKKYL